MAVNSDAYVVPTIGRVYLAPVGTPAPDVSELGSPASPWEIVGHVGTADGDGLPTFVADGGDVTSLGSWNQRVVRSVAEPLTETVEFSMSQVDETSLSLYTSAEGGSTTNRFDVMGSEIGQGRDYALLIVIQDRDLYLGWHASKVTVRRGDDIEFDPEGPILLPLSCTLLDLDDETPRYSWIASFINSDES